MAGFKLFLLLEKESPLQATPSFFEDFHLETQQVDFLFLHLQVLDMELV